jgi:hypothetical protein
MRLRVAVGAVAAAVLALYVLRLDSAAGLFVDDAWYIVLAKSLWQGDGFRLISSAVSPILPAFPPGFPLMLAPVFGIAGDFPANVVVFKTISILAMCGVVAATYIYMVRYRSAPMAVAAIVALITALMPAFVFLATSTVMSEIVFTLAQLCLVLAIEWAARVRGGRLTGAAAISGLLGGATLLVRAGGVAPVAAAALYLWRRRGRHAALTFVIVTASCYAPWVWYAIANSTPDVERLRHGGSVAYGYSQLLQMQRGGYEAEGRVSWRGLAGRIASNALDIAGRDVGAFLVPAVYRAPSESGQEVFGMSGETGIRASSMGGAWATVWVSLAVSGFVLAGYLAAARRGATVVELIVPMTIVMVALVPALTFRYVLPLAPFVVFYFFCGLERARAALPPYPDRTFGAVFRVAAACIVLLFAAEHAQYIWAARHGPQPSWLQEHRETTALLHWMTTRLPGDGYTASNNPGLVYLATGRRSVSMGDARNRWRDWQTTGVQYGVAIHPAPQPPPDLGYRVLYESAGRTLWVIELLPGLTENASPR